MSFKTILTIFALVFSLSALTSSVRAQGTTSRITGTVTDGSGAAVAGATVTLTNEGTNVSSTTETSDSGIYTFDLIQIGNYSVSVEKAGFKKFVSKENAVSVNLAATVNVTMEIGGVAETVTVEGTVEQVQTSSSGNLGTTIDQRTVESLPIVGSRGRNPLSLLNFQPGIVSGINSAGGGVHVNGSRDRSFNFTLDGIDINESSAGGSNFTPLRPNPDSIQEFQVVTSNFTAELGRSSGAQVTFVTRSGTNQVRGSVFEFYRTPELNANEYQNNLNGRPKDQFVQHIFGGSVGGPIIKDKFFFFGNVQLLRSVDTAFITRTVYTEAARNGLFRYVSGTQANADGTVSTRQNAPTGTGTPSVDANGNPLFAACPATLPNPIPVGFACLNSYNVAANPSGVGLDPAIRQVLNTTPLPNNFSTGDGLNTAGYTFGTPGRERQYDFVSKFDYTFDQNSLLYVRYAQGEQNTFGDGGANGGRPIFPDTPNIVDTFRSPKNLAINYRWSPTSNIINEFIFGWSKFAFSFDTPEADPTIPYAFNLVAAPNINLASNARSVNTYQVIDNITWVKGDHTVKGGVNLRFNRAFDNRSGVGGPVNQIEPRVLFNPAATTFGAFALPATGINAANDLPRLRSTINDLLGRIGTYDQAYVSDPNNPNQFAPAGTRWTFETTYREYDFYIQDTYKLRSNLTFDLGLRWEFKLAPESDGRPILAPDKPVTLGAAPANDIRFVERKLFDNDLNNLSPSIGFAWDPFKKGKTSIRANYRLAYDRFATFLFSSSIFQSTPGNTFLGTNPNFNTGIGTATGANLIRNGLPNLAPTTTPENLRTPTAFSTNSITVVDPDLKFPEIHQFALSMQHEIFKDTVLEVNILGKRGTNLIGGYDANQINLNATDPRCGSQTFLQAFQAVQNSTAASNPGGVCLINYLIAGNNTTGAGTALFRTNAQFGAQVGTATAAGTNAVGAVAQALSQRTGATSLAANGFSPFFFQRFTQFTGGLNVIDSNDISKYRAMELILKRRFNRGLGFQFGYTFARSKDTRSFDPVFTTVSRGSAQAASSTPFDINNRQLNFAPSDFDRRHSFQATYVYELPFGRGRAFGSEIPRALDYIIGGWQLAGNVLWTSGSPFTVYSGSNTFSNVVQSTADCNGCSRDIGRLVQESGTNFWFDAETRALFSNPVAGSNGNTGRNYFIKPRYFQTDLSVSKNFQITERFNLDARLEAQNLTNNPSFDNPTAVFNSTIFGRIRDSVISGSRKMQASLKLNF